jgi:Flp pilus assembly pilin Flp
MRRGLKFMLSFLRRLGGDQRGVTVVEYALIICLIGTAAYRTESGCKTVLLTGATATVTISYPCSLSALGVTGGGHDHKG